MCYLTIIDFAIFLLEKRKCKSIEFIDALQLYSLNPGI